MYSEVESMLKGYSKGLKKIIKGKEYEASGTILWTNAKNYYI
jgi:hypothetical protein